MEGGPGRLTGTSYEATGSFLPGPILLMGAPGVGKGTQSRELVARWAIPQISTGDLLRSNMSSGSALGREARRLMDAGVLVPDELVNQMVDQRLRNPDAARGYILDGYPRTLGQAEWLDAHLAQAAKPAGPEVSGLPLVAVELRVEYTQLLRRITGRRICPVCGSIYNIYLQPPARDGFCDLDGAPLQCRDDDSEAVFESRMRAYEQLTAPVLGHYAELGRLVAVDGENDPAEVTAQVVEAVQKLRSGV